MLQAIDSGFRQLADALLGASHLLLRHPLRGDPELAAFLVTAALCHGAVTRTSELNDVIRTDLWCEHSADRRKELRVKVLLDCCLLQKRVHARKW
jgi:hypothetical protein